MTNESTERVRGWFTGRLPQEWTTEPAQVTVDRDEVTVVLTIGDVAAGESPVEQAEARAGRAKAFREETRETRMKIAREAEHRFERKVSWGVRLGTGEEARSELWTHVSSPVMTRLRQPQRLVLDTLVEAGVAKSRSDALAWCVRLVGQHEGDWLADLRGALSHVDDVRSKGPVS